MLMKTLAIDWWLSPNSSSLCC